MKKYFIMLALMLATNVCSFASEGVNNDGHKLDKLEMFTFNVNHKKLAKTLELDNEQIDFVDYAMDEFENDMKFASTVESYESRYGVIRSLVEKNLMLMRSFLTPRQFRKYSALINVTLVNKGFDMEKITKK